VMHDSVVIWAADNYYTMSDLTFLWGSSSFKNIVSLV
jgi:hypothetical protein